MSSAALFISETHREVGAANQAAGDGFRLLRPLPFKGLGPLRERNKELSFTVDNDYKNLNKIHLSLCTRCDLSDVGNSDARIEIRCEL